MHWYDQFKTEYKKECWQFGDCDGDCEQCDQFQQDFADYVGFNERIWPYDYLVQEQYEEACMFANEADSIVSEDEVQWWCGINETFGEVKVSAIDPRDFGDRITYNEAINQYLFAEAISHHPQIPPSELWYRLFVNLLEDSESAFCAEKSIVAILEELNYDEDYPHDVQQIVVSSELEHEIRYSSWDRHPEIKRYSRHRRHYTEHAKSANIEKYTAQQFRNDLVYHYPGLYRLSYQLALKDIDTYDLLTPYGVHRIPIRDMNGTAHSRTIDTILQYLPDIISDALYLYDLFAFNVEDCVCNGILGLLNAIKGVVDTDRYRVFCRVYMIENASELMDFMGVSINRTTAKTIVRLVFGQERADRLSHYDILPISSYHSSRSYDDATHLIESIRRFMALENPIGLIPLVEFDGCYMERDAEMCRTDAIALLKELVAKLPDREKDYLTRRYGLNNNNPQTLEEIANTYGHTREWARQVEKKAFSLLQRMPGFADICELTGQPIPPGAMHITHHLKSESHENQNTGVQEVKPLLISECGASVRLYSRLRKCNIIFIDQLLELTLEQLRDIPVDLRWWYESIVHFRNAGIAPSDAMNALIKPYRPPTRLWIEDCKFSSKFKKVMTRADIYRVDTLQSMSTSALQKYRSLTETDWQEVDECLRAAGVVPSESIMELAHTSYD